MNEQAPNTPTEFEGAIVPHTAVLTTGGPMAAEIIATSPLGAPFVATRISFEIVVEGGRSVVRGAMQSAHDDKVMLRYVATEIVQRELDVWGLVHLEAFYVNLHRWKFPGEDWFYFRDNLPDLRDLDDIQIENACKSIQAAFMDVRYQIALGGALSDFRAAVLDRQRTGMHCYRAAECLRHCFAKPEEKERRGKHRDRMWKRMQEALGIPDSDNDLLLSASIPSRHGESVELPAEQRMELIRIARTTILNFARWAAEQPH